MTEGEKLPKTPQNTGHLPPAPVVVKTVPHKTKPSQELCGYSTCRCMLSFRGLDKGHLFGIIDPQLEKGYIFLFQVNLSISPSSDPSSWRPTFILISRGTIDQMPEQFPTYQKAFHHYLESHPHPHNFLPNEFQFPSPFPTFFPIILR